MQELVIKDIIEEVRCFCGSISDYGCHGVRDGMAYSEFYCKACYNKKDKWMAIIEYNDLQDMHDQMEELENQNGRIIIENQRLKKENKAFQEALGVAFDAIQYYKTMEDSSGCFVFVATEAVEKVDNIMDKVFDKWQKEKFD